MVTLPEHFTSATTSSRPWPAGWQGRTGSLHRRRRVNRASLTPPSPGTLRSARARSVLDTPVDRGHSNRQEAAKRRRALLCRRQRSLSLSREQDNSRWRRPDDGPSGRHLSRVAHAERTRAPRSGSACMFESSARQVSRRRFLGLVAVTAALPLVAALWLVRAHDGHASRQQAGRDRSPLSQAAKRSRRHRPRARSDRGARGPRPGRRGGPKAGRRQQGDRAHLPAGELIHPGLRRALQDRNRAEVQARDRHRPQLRRHQRRRAPGQDHGRGRDQFRPGRLDDGRSTGRCSTTRSSRT